MAVALRVPSRHYLRKSGAATTRPDAADVLGKRLLKEAFDERAAENR
jgi:hypothetical protein